jgi:hypothetical protein
MFPGSTRVAKRRTAVDTKNFGSRYLLKLAIQSVRAISCEGVGSLFWLDLEEFCNCFARIAFDDQSFFLGARFTLSALRLWFFWHLVLLSPRFLVGVEMVPQPGIGPGSPDWARGCKPRLYANSSTGAHRTGTVTAVPVSLHRLHCKNSERYTVVLGIEVRPSPKHNVLICRICCFCFKLLDSSLSGQSRQHRVNGRRSVLLGGQIESPSFQSFNNLTCAERSLFPLHYLQAGFCNPKPVHHWFLTAHRCEGRDCAAEPINLAVENVALVVNFFESACRSIKGSSGFLQRRTVGSNLILCHGVSI